MSFLSRHPGSRFRGGIAVGLALYGAAMSSSAAEPVQALRYGTTLFHFYQQDYFNALTELGAAQQLNQLDVHTDRAQLLRGGMSLSYGMDRVAQDIFENYLAQSTDTDEADRAWFYLGKMAWHRGDVPRAAAALARLSPGFSGELAEEATYLRASVGLRAGQADVGPIVQSLPDDSKWRYYLYYNMGASHAARGEWDASTAILGEFATMPLYSPETDALQDKAFTAAGFAHLAAQEYAAARAVFSRVRLDSPLAERALLGFGWSASEMGDYHAALSPWEALASRSVLNESARESLLALPYAYEQLRRPGIALDRYRLASATYTVELQSLQTATEAFRRGELRPLLDIDQEITGDWFFAADVMPQGEFSGYLQHLVGAHGFQVAVRELRDLYSIAGHLQRAAERLEVLREVDVHQRGVWSAVLQGDQQAQLRQRHRDLEQAVKRLQQRIEIALAQGDGHLLADEARREQWSRLERAERSAAALQDAAQHDARLALLRGLLVFDDSERQPTRAWAVQRELAELERLEQVSRDGLQQLELALAQRRENEFSARIAQLNERVKQQSGDVALAINRSEQGVRQLAVAELERQSEQLSRALGRSNLAIARLYDQGSMEGVQ